MKSWVTLMVIASRVTSVDGLGAFFVTITTAVISSSTPPIVATGEPGTSADKISILWIVNTSVLKSLDIAICCSSAWSSGMSPGPHRSTRTRMPAISIARSHLEGRTKSGSSLEMRKGLHVKSCFVIKSSAAFCGLRVTSIIGKKPSRIRR